MFTVIPLGHFVWPGLLHLPHLLVASLFFHTVVWMIFSNASLIMSLICLKHFSGLPVLSVESINSLNFLAYWAKWPGPYFPLQFHLIPDSTFFFLLQAATRVLLWFLDCALLPVFLKAIRRERKAQRKARKRDPRRKALGVFKELKEDKAG